MSESFLDKFNQYFEMVPAQSDELKNEVYKLRYKVYCIETGFEDPSLYSSGMEVDEFDDNSIHYLIRHRPSCLFAATTRVILPEQRNPLPIEIHSTIDNLEPLKNIQRNKLAEVSRFCVSKEFKRRKNEPGSLTGTGYESFGGISNDERRIFPHITIGLIACLIRISEEQGIHHWCAVMEPGLFRFLSTLGINFTGLGPVSEYHGKRMPGVIKVTDLLNSVLQKNPQLWYLLTNNGQFGLFL